MAQETYQNLSQLVQSQKAAIYIRVSTHWQVDKDSLQVQRRELTAYCQLVLGINDFVVFEDPGYSAKNTDRPAYQQMISRLRTGEFSHVVVWKIDRISRNLLDFAAMYSELKKLGVVFVSKNEQFDTSSAIGEAMLKIILVFAELERNMTSERVSAVMLSRASNGQWNGGRIPYGYARNSDTGEFFLDPTEAPIVQRIYDLYEAHHSTFFVANALNGEGLQTRSGAKWSSVAVHKILTNPFYYGAYRYNIRQGNTGSKRKDAEWVMVEDQHIPIVSKERFDTIQYRMKQNKRGGNQRGQSVQRKNFHIFAGMLECGCCGSRMTATPGKLRADGWAPSTYGCYNRRKSSSVCRSKFVSDAALVPFVLGYISNILRMQDKASPRTSDEVLERWLLRGDYFGEVAHLSQETLNGIRNSLQDGQKGIRYEPSAFAENHGGSEEKEIAALEQEKRRANTAMSRLQTLYLYSDSGIPEKDFIIERQRIADELSTIDSKLSKLHSSEVALRSEEQAFIEKASYFLMVEHLLNDKLDDPTSFVRVVDHAVIKAFVHAIISKIVVTNGRVTEIVFRSGIRSEFTYK